MKGQQTYTPWPQHATRPEPQLATHANVQSKPQPISRAALALLDEYTAEHSRRGYDPYNTQSSRGLSDDVWFRKPKRD